MSGTAADDPPPSFESVQDDPYVILGVETTATDDEIKSAYKKLCLKWHPDKNQGDSDAEIMFQKVQTAWGILSSPELRAKYDAGGMDALEGNALSENGIQVDISQTGFMGSTLLAMFRKLGHPIKTVVSPTVLDAVKQPSALTTAPLEWGVPVTGKVGNGQAMFYVLDIAAEHLEQGFAVVASCSHARVKLLLWDLDADGNWSLAAQEDAVKVGQVNATALYATSVELLEGVPRSVQAHVQAAAMVDRSQQDPFAHIFRVLDAAKLKDRLTLKPGQHLLAVYGDNFFKRSQFTLRAALMAEGSERDEVAATEREIIDKRAELLAFEREFKRTRQEFEASVSKLEDYTKELDTLFTKREVEYAGLLGLAPPVATATPSASGALPEESDAAAAEGGSGPGTPGPTLGTDDGQSGSLGMGLGSGGSSATFVTEQAKVIRNAASQAGTQISGAFRGLFSKTGQRKTDPGWSSTDVPPTADMPPPTAGDSPEPAANPVSSRARSFFRAFSARTSQTGTASPELPQAGELSGGVIPEEAVADVGAAAEPAAGGMPAEPLAAAPAAAPVAAETAAVDPVAAEAPAGGSGDASASLSGALVVSGLPHGDDSAPNTPAAPAAAEDTADAVAEAVGDDGTAAAAAPADDTAAAPAVVESGAGENLPSDAVTPVDAEAPAIDAPAAVDAATLEAPSPEASAAEASPAAALDAVGEAPEASVASQDPPAEAETAAAESVEEPPAAAEEEPSPELAPAEGPPADEAPAAVAVAEDAAAEAPTGVDDAAAASAESAPAAETSGDVFADAPEAEDSKPSPVKPPSKEGSASSLVKRMQERFLQASQP